MKLSAPIHKLKRNAKLAARNTDIPLHSALDAIARREGFASWSLLAARASQASLVCRLYDSLGPGDLLLIGARPGQGKTLLSLELAIEAMKAGHRSAFFSLEYTENDILSRFHALGVDPGRFGSLFDFDSSDAICADYVAAKLFSAAAGTLLVIDYLQILDHRRENPDLMTQVSSLKRFARERGVIIVFVSQIDRCYDPSKQPFPDLSNVRLPNPLDLGLFDKTCFLSNGEARFQAATR